MLIEQNIPLSDVGVFAPKQVAVPVKSHNTYRFLKRMGIIHQRVSGLRTSFGLESHTVRALDDKRVDCLHCLLAAQYQSQEWVLC